MTTEMATLTGTEKQIAWAETIRSQAMASVEQAIHELRTAVERAESSGHTDRAQVIRENINRYESALVFLGNQTQATFWIDNRDYDFAEFTNLFTKTGKRIPYMALITGSVTA